MHPPFTADSQRLSTPGPRPEPLAVPTNPHIRQQIPIHKNFPLPTPGLHRRAQPRRALAGPGDGGVASEIDATGIVLEAGVDDAGGTWKAVYKRCYGVGRTRFPSLAEEHDLPGSGRIAFDIRKGAEFCASTVSRTHHGRTSASEPCDTAPTGCMNIESTPRNTRCASRDAGAMPTHRAVLLSPHG